jgi:hypothetical protein
MLPRIENGELRIEDFNSQLSILNSSGAVAQLGEHLLCKQRVVGSIPISSTNHLPIPQPEPAVPTEQSVPSADPK